MTNKGKVITKDYEKYALILKLSNLSFVVASGLCITVLHFKNSIAMFIGIGMVLVTGLAITIEGLIALGLGPKRKERPYKEKYERFTFYLYAYATSVNAILLIILFVICLFA